MAWVWLGVAGLFEVVWAVLLIDPALIVLT